jgi:hypothetical protein
MKTLRLTRAESAAYAAGERRFWRAMRKQPRVGTRGDGSIIHPEYLFWEDKQECPYGTPGDPLVLAHGEMVEDIFYIAKIEVTERDGKWGWLVEVGA